MLKTIKKLFIGDSSIKMRRIPASEHRINRDLISPNAIRVIQELKAAGWEAYLVGGGVRDLLLGGAPKDFDIATNATPEQVQTVFRRARVIGRRFKIVHVRMGREVLEVTTFRGSHTADSGTKQHSVQSERGILLRDNVYGDLESDALRRDFTLNALYYEPESEEVIDYCGGLEDLRRRHLKIIGEPSARYKEDPVRMLRAVRFICKLGLSIDPATERPIREHSEYLREIPAARLFEEVLKLLLSGYARTILDALHEYHLLQHLVPDAAKAFEHGIETQRAMILNASANTDRRISEGKRVTPAFIYAALLWPGLQQRLGSGSHTVSQEEFIRAADSTVFLQQQYTAIPKRFLIPMREIWSLQQRFNRRDPKRAFALLEHPRFRAAYDFLLLREESGEHTQKLGEWWTQFQFAERDEQMAMIKRCSTTAPDKKRRRRRRKPPAAPTPEHD